MATRIGGLWRRLTRALDRGGARHHIAAALQRNERYRLFVETAIEGVLSLDRHAIITFANPQMCAMLGYTVDEVVGQPYASFVAPEEQKANCEQMRLRARGEDAVYERCFITKDGRRHVLLVSAKALRAANGDFDGSFAMFTDIDQRKRIEAALQASEQRYRRFVETAIEGVLSLDHHAIITFANPQMCAMLGATVEQVVGQPYAAFIAPEEQDANREQMRIRAQGRNAVYERCFIRQDGRRHWLLVSAKAVMTDSGSFAGSFAMFTDIDERKRIESALQASERQYRLIVDTAMEGVLSLDATDRITFVNQQMCSLLGYAAEEMLGRPYESFIAPDQVDDFRVQAERRAQGCDSRYERCLVTKSGERHWVLVSARAVRNEQGQVVGSFGMFTDIHQRKQIELERERLITELQSALDQIRTLRGIVPICANCKKIRNDAGYWEQVEEYVTHHTEAQFSHGLCPACISTLYPELGDLEADGQTG